MNKDLSNYNWITSDGKTVRPYNPYNTRRGKAFHDEFEAEVKHLVFDCEGLTPNKVYRGEELQVYYEGLYGTVKCKIDEHTYNSYLKFKDEIRWALSNVRICIKLKEQPKEEEPTTQEIRAVETVEQAAERLYPNVIDSDWEETSPEDFARFNALKRNYRNVFQFGAQYALQNLPIKEILELVAERARANSFLTGNLEVIQEIDKQSILSLEEEILKLINNQK